MKKTTKLLKSTTKQLNSDTLPKVQVPRRKRIESLTDEEKSYMRQWADEYIKIGLDTTPADRPRAEAAIRACYRLSGLKEPEQIVWCKNPLETVREGPRLAKELSPGVPANWTEYFGGQFWVGWYYGPASVSFLIDVCGLDMGSDIELRARAYQAVCQSACWWWPHEKVCTVSERPHTIKMENGRLHCPNGPALAWEGLEVYAFRGVRVPKNWIMDTKNLPVETALTHQNVEQRNVAAQLIGWERVLKEVKARVIDTDPDPQIGQLLEADLPQAERSRFLRVKCGTGRTFCLPVPAECTTALEANAWTYDIKKVDLNQFRDYAVRT